MSRLVEFGTFVDSGKLFKADLDIILRSNALLQANSGGGKSWALRRMIEQSFRRVPQIVIDPEGEFSTLREKFDFVLVGKGGDTPADLRSAGLLAHRLLELGASAIIDLYEMSKPMRPQWVAAFVQALVDAPKKLWRELLLYVDEAHELAPEPGHGTSESRDEKLCRHALIDFAAKGRKRGYGVVAATQRLGKLSKDFAAELKNALVGQTWIDIDRERAAGTLGIAKAAKQEFFRNVKNLEPGSFYALGRAFTLEPTLVLSGPVQTEHPTPGRRQSAPPPPTAKIVHLLPQLADLPKEAEQKVLTEKELRARIAELEREVKAKAPALVSVTAKVVERAILSAATIQRLERLVAKLVTSENGFVEVGLVAIDKQRDRLAQAQQAVVSELGNVRTVLAKAVQPPARVTTTPVLPPRKHEMFHNPRQPPADVRELPATPSRQAHTVDDTTPLPPGAQRMLAALRSSLTDTMSDAHVAMLAGMKRSGTFSNYKSALKVGGYVDVSGGMFRLTEKGRAFQLDENVPAGGVELLKYWRGKLPPKVGQMLEFIVNNGSSTDDAIIEAVQMAKSGTYSNYKSLLMSRGLIRKTGNGYEPSELFAR